MGVPGVQKGRVYAKAGHSLSLGSWDSHTGSRQLNSGPFSISSLSSFCVFALQLQGGCTGEGGGVPGVRAPPSPARAHVASACTYRRTHTSILALSSSRVHTHTRALTCTLAHAQSSLALSALTWPLSLCGALEWGWDPGPVPGRWRSPFWAMGSCSPPQLLACHLWSSTHRWTSTCRFASSKSS